jgi:hypothetical protein
MTLGPGINNRIVPALLFGALILWGCSLLMPALQARGGPSLDGYEVLLRGWSAWRNGVFAWFANPLLLLAIVAAWRKRHRLAAVSVGLGVVLAATSLVAENTARYSGASIPDFSFLVGFYIWMGAHLAAALGVTLGMPMRNQS